MPTHRFIRLLAGSAMATVALAGCAGGGGSELPPASFVSMQEGPGEELTGPHRVVRVVC